MSLQRRWTPRYASATSSALERRSRFQEGPSFVRDLFGLKIRLGGGGYRRTTRRAPFLNNLNNVAPQLVSSASTPGLWQSLATVLGDDSFNDANEKQRWAALYASGSRFGEALKAEWQRLQQLRTEAMAAAGAQDATKSILDADHNSFGHGTSKPHKRVFDEIGSLGRDAVSRRAEELPRDDPRRMAFLASGDCRFSNQLLLGTPIEALRLTAREFRSAVQNKLGVPQSR